jgi:hypothetical protein
MTVFSTSGAEPSGCATVRTRNLISYFNYLMPLRAEGVCNLH